MIQWGPLQSDTKETQWLSRKNEWEKNSSLRKSFGQYEIRFQKVLKIEWTKLAKCLPDVLASFHSMAPASIPAVPTIHQCFFCLPPLVPLSLAMCHLRHYLPTPAIPANALSVPANSSSSTSVLYHLPLTFSAFKQCFRRGVGAATDRRFIPPSPGSSPSLAFLILWAPHSLLF